MRDDKAAADAAAAATATDLSGLNRTHVLHKSRGGCQTLFRLKVYFDGPPLQSPIDQSSVSSSNGKNMSVQGRRRRYDGKGE